MYTFTFVRDKKESERESNDGGEKREVEGVERKRDERVCLLAASVNAGKF